MRLVKNNDGGYDIPTKDETSPGFNAFAYRENENDIAVSLGRGGRLPSKDSLR